MLKRTCAVLVLSLTGCSFVFTRGPDAPPRIYPECTSSMTWPIVDGVLSGLFLAAMVGAITADDKMDTTTNDDGASKGEKVASSAFVAALAGVSAYVGYSRVSKCRRARETFQAQYPGGYPGAYPYAAPQPYSQQTVPPPALAQPAPVPAANALGTEGDVCAASAECATGLTCTSNVCIRPASRP